MQIRQCFGETFTDTVSTRQQEVHRVWVASNQKISKETVNAIRSGVSNPTMIGNVRFIDGDLLWELVEKHLPLSLLHYLDEVQKKAQTIDTHYDPLITMSANGATITFKEKFAGASKQKPIHITPRFVDQQAADQFGASMQRFRETGEGVDIPSSSIAGVDLPDFLQSIVGPTDHQEYAIRMLPTPNSATLPVRITFLATDGDSYVCHFVRLRTVRAGTKEAIVRSEPGDAPIEIEISLRNDTRETNVSLRPILVSDDAVNMSNFIKISRCLSKSPTFKLENLRNGSILAQGQTNSDGFECPSDGYVEIIELLAIIQNSIEVPIVVPERDLTEEEVVLIHEVHEIVTKGRLEGTWIDASATFRPDLPTLEIFVADLADDKATVLAFDEEETVELFGVPIPLGHVRHILRSAKCKNYQEIVARYDDLRSGTASITLHLVAGEDDLIIKEYTKWVAAQSHMASTAPV